MESSSDDDAPIMAMKRNKVNKNDQDESSSSSDDDAPIMAICKSNKPNEVNNNTNNDELCSSSDDDESNDDDNYTQSDDEYSPYETMEAEATKSPLKSHELLEELLIYGYVRLNKETKGRLPKDILDLVIKWYHVDSYFALYGDKCTLNPTKTTVTYNGFAIPYWRTDAVDGEAEKEPNCCYHSIIMPSISEKDIEYVYKLKIKQLQDIICIGIDSTNGDYINDDFTNQKTTYHYSFYSKAGTGYCQRNACSGTDKKKHPYRGWTYGHPYKEDDIVIMYYNPYHSTVQFELDGQDCKEKFQKMDVYKKMGLQYRLCIYMGDYGKQCVKLLDYKVIGDVDTDESDQEENENDDGQIAIAAPQLDDESQFDNEWSEEEEIEKSEIDESYDNEDKSIKEKEVELEELFAKLFADISNDGKDVAFASNSFDLESQEIERYDTKQRSGLNYGNNPFYKINNFGDNAKHLFTFGENQHGFEWIFEEPVSYAQYSDDEKWWKENEIKQMKKWNYNNDYFDGNRNSDGNRQTLLTFNANQGGIDDLEAEKILNKFGNDGSIQFGVDDNDDVPYNYICKGCGNVGHHWIMDCMHLRQDIQ